MSEMQIRKYNQIRNNTSKGTKTALVLSFMSALFCFGLVNNTFAQTTEEQLIIDYCFGHADSILLGNNPVNDLVSTGMIPSSYLNQTCADVKTQSEINQHWHDTLNEFMVK